MKKLMTILAITCFSVISLVGCSNTSTKEQAVATTAATPTREPVILTGKHHVEIEVDTLGTIKVELDADTAPVTVNNFITLANNKFYDGLTFHRIINNFMIQGGDPLGNGTGGSDKTIKGEFKSNGVKNAISHVRGTISMARSAQSYDSASSQFFICQADAKYLDGEYAAFGKVTSGMEIVDQIAKTTTVQDKNGTVAKENQPVIKTIKVID
ncbi:MAG: peptidylprolyl isomerase [bacterium]|nr:peptidylprolyl isomerase [bacterium]